MRNWSEDDIGCVIYVLVAVISIAISVGIAYWIAVSDMPEWLKFWLLK